MVWPRRRHPAICLFSQHRAGRAGRCAGVLAGLRLSIHADGRSLGRWTFIRSTGLTFPARWGKLFSLLRIWPGSRESFPERPPWTLALFESCARLLVTAV